MLYLKELPQAGTMYRLRPMAACLAQRNLARRAHQRAMSTLGTAATGNGSVPLFSSMWVYRHPACHHVHRSVHTEPEAPADKPEGTAPLDTRQPRSLHKNTERDLWEVCALWLILRTFRLIWLTACTEARGYTCTITFIRS